MDVLLAATLLVVLSLASIWAFIDGLLQPDRAWRDAGISQGVTTAVLLFTCGVGALYYFLSIRPRLLRAQGRA